MQLRRRFEQRLSRLIWTAAWRDTLLIGLGIGLFLIGVGLNGHALPFPRSGDYSDAVTSHWPNALFLQRSVRAGQFPLWRPLIMSGQPFAANPLNKVWYPPQWLAIVLPPTLHLNLLLWLHLTLAGVGMRAFARRIGFTAGIAGLMGMAFALTPRLIGVAGAGHLDIVYAVGWFPWLMWAATEGSAERTPKMASLQEAARDMGSDGIAAVRSKVPLSINPLIMGPLIALCFLADVRTSVFIFALVGSYALWQSNQRRRTAIRLAAAGAIAAALTAVEWLPLLTVLPALSRAGLTAADASVFSVQPAQWLSVLFGDRGGNYETMMYVGVGVLALALVGFLSAWRKRWGWGAAAVIAAWYALGSNGVLWMAVVRFIPGLVWLRVPPRVWFVGVFALIVLAGYGLQSVSRPARRVPRSVLITSALLIVMGIALTIITLPGGAVTALLKLAFVIMFALMLIAGRRVPLSAWAALIVIDLLLMDGSLIEGRDQAVWLDRYAPLLTALVDANAARVYSPSYSVPQQAAAYWNLQTFGGIDPFQFADYVHAFEQATGVHASGYTVTLPAFDGDPATVNRDAPIDTDQLAKWRVSHLVSAYPLNAAGLQLIKEIDGLYLYQNTRYNPSANPIQWLNANQFTLDANRPIDGVLPDLSGWKQETIGGKTLYTYVAPDEMVALLISGATVLGCAALGVLTIWIGQMRRRASYAA